VQLQCGLDLVLDVNVFVFVYLLLRNQIHYELILQTHSLVRTTNDN